MSEKDLQKAIKLQEYAATGINATAPVNIYMLPQDIMENTIRAFSVSATSATGYGSLGAPTGRYLAPANGPDCIETIANGYGDCGMRTLVVTGPMYARWDISAVKRTRLVGRTTFEFRADLLNAFNHPNFTPVISTSTNADNYRITGVQENSSRIIQLVTRFQLVARTGSEIGIEGSVRRRRGDVGRRLGCRDRSPCQSPTCISPIRQSDILPRCARSKSPCIFVRPKGCS